MVSHICTAVLILSSFGVTFSQRKYSRNVAVAADVKTRAHFDCPEEFGYYPHPSDCTQYYVCVFGGALLESCTGGLMYSHELQTCDWPRNVGCDGVELSGSPQSTVSVAPSTASTRGRERDRERERERERDRDRERDREESRSKYTPPPPPSQPAAVVTSRGQPRQLHHSKQQEFIKQQQQQQLYADAEETLPPAEEVESDRQQRVYRGQPSTVGQVQRDRDGLRHSNAIPTYSGRGEKIGVISFGTQNQHYSDGSSPASPQSTAATATATARTNSVYSNNSTQFSGNHYEPYYTLYDDDVELYRDVEYAQNNFNTNLPRSQTTAYRERGTPPPVVQTTSVREEVPKRGNTVYLQNNYNQDIYQQSTVADYNEDNRYDTQVDDQNSYRQPSSRKPVTTNENQTQAQSDIGTKPEGPLYTENPLSLPSFQKQRNRYSNRQDSDDPLPVTFKPTDFKLNTDLSFSLHVHDPEPDHDNIRTFLHSELLTTEKPAFHYITKASRTKNTLVKETVPDSIESPSAIVQTNEHHTSATTNTKVIVPTTYSPPKFFLRSILPKPNLFHTTPIFRMRTTDRPNSGIDFKPQNNFLKALKAVRKLINPVSVNHALSATASPSYESAEELASDNAFGNTTSDLRPPYYKPPAQTKAEYSDEESKSKDSNISSTTLKLFVSKLSSTNTDNSETSSKGTTKSTIITSTTEKGTTIPDVILTPTEASDINKEYISKKLETEKYKYYIDHNQGNYTSPKQKKFRTTIEVPPAHELIDNEYKSKPEPDQPPAYKPKPYPKPFIPTSTKTDAFHSTFPPTRVSRVNPAIKSLIAIGGTRRPNSKCNENQSPNSKCNDIKQRTSSRGRGTAHFANTGAQIVNNEVTINTNRGTPAPRSRPTLKPSNSIVSKVQEFVDIYRYPPRRPDPIYPQPQPDKTAAKCRKDVCLLPDCNCGGKDIPGNVPAEETPQMVLITFDDAINDLNKEYYTELFENGRKNPNGCPITATFYVSHEWSDYSQVQNLYADGHEMASHTVSHSFGEQFSQKKWTREAAGQREILSAYGGVRLEDVRGLRAPFLSVGGNKMFKMLYDSNFTYDSSMPIYENKPPSWPYTLDYKLFHDCMIPPCPTRSYPGVWEVPMVMWQDLNGGRCSMGDACSNPPDAEGVFKMLTKNFQRHYTTNRAPFGLFYHAAWFTQPHHKEGFINFIDSILTMKDVWLLTNWQAIQWVRDPTPSSRLNSFQPFHCDYSDRPKRCNNPKVCNLWHKSGVRYMRTCQPCPDIYPWTGNTGIRSSRIDNDIED